MLDACVLFRLDKCEALPRLKGLAPLHVAASVHAELSKDGPRLRKLLTELRMTKHPVVPGSREWDELARIRGGLFSNQDLGEAESLAVVLVAAQKQRFLPLATFDGGAARTANRLGVPVLDFLSLLAWMVACGCMSFEEADDLETLAAQRNGWKRPSSYRGSVEAHASELRQSTGAAIFDWKARVKGFQKRKGSTTRRKS
ncbi:hypothetical protein [Myxococcus sp. AB025B]|uniref:hypothetical protein n=1 Tax=Myxococcus sp. AB025B TaxID=2562794 RepID=UPI0011419B5A|nr:hypothetical protein [Myxococcus sp. AB025B]